MSLQAGGEKTSFLHHIAVEPIVMTAVISHPGTEAKLKILSTDAQYDLACACGTNKDDRRTRSGDDKWIYPVSLPNGGKSVLFKTLI